MNNTMEYKGYHAKIEYSHDDKCFVGYVCGINDRLIFDGNTVEELENMFHENIDDYLILCQEIGKDPDKEYKGSFNVRIDPELHRKAALESEVRGVSLNKFVSVSIAAELRGNHNVEKITYVMPSEFINCVLNSKSSTKDFQFLNKEVSECTTLNVNW